jgi:hypothetical protein
VKRVWLLGVALVVLFASVAEARGGMRFHIPDGWKRVWEAPGNAAPELGAEERARLEREHVILAAVEPSIEGATLNVTVLESEPVQTEAALDAFIDGMRKTMGEATVVSRELFKVHGAKAARIVVDQKTDAGVMRSGVYLLPGEHEQGTMVFRLPVARFNGALRRIEASVNATTGLADDSFVRVDRLAKLAGTVFGAAIGVGAVVLVLRRKKRAS